MPATTKRKVIIEPQQSTERWLLTFNDMMTLMLTFFVLLMSMSSLDIKSLQGVQQEIHNVLGIEHPVPPESTGTTDPLILLDDLKRKKARVQGMPWGALKQDEEDAEISNIAAVLRDIFKIPVTDDGGDQFTTTDAAGKTHKFKGIIDDSYYEPGITLQRQKRGIVLKLPSSILFATADAVLNTKAYPVLDSVAAILTKTKLYVYIEGHTDAQPITTAPYASNAELSVARASSVVQYLIERHRVTPERIGISGYGDAVPLLPNDTAINRAANRRVEIVFSRH